MQRNHKVPSALAGIVVTAKTGTTSAIAAPSADRASGDAAHRTVVDIDVWGDINRVEYEDSSVVGYTIVKTWPSVQTGTV